ncbi:IMPACT family protein [Hydrogenimonas sp.]
MKRVVKQFFAETEVKRSKFLSFLVPIEEFETIRRDLRKEHPKANHIVWALRGVDSYDRIVEDSSDDGEPKGCAGRPVLHTMQGNGLVESAILVVRYFGGIKLGTGGMARAYGEAAKRVVEAAETIVYEKRGKMRFFTPYHDVSRVEHLLVTMEIREIVRNFDDRGASWEISLPLSLVSPLAGRLKEMRIDFLIE